MAGRSMDRESFCHHISESLLVLTDAGLWNRWEGILQHFAADVPDFTAIFK